jgi:hypothetical protein
LWATYALTSDLAQLPKQSGASLKKWIESDMSPSIAEDDAEATAWDMSGVPQLLDSIGARIAKGIGDASVQRIAESAINLASGIAAADEIGRARSDASDQPALRPDAALEKMREMETRFKTALSEDFDTVLDGFRARVERAQASFLDRATNSLIAHLDKFGQDTPWTYDPTGLRVLLNSSHKVLTAKSVGAYSSAAQAAATEIATLYRQVYGEAAADIRIEIPDAPHVPPPVELGQTIALDLSTTWWKSWWAKRRGYEKFASSYAELIKAETEPCVNALRSDIAADLRTRFTSAFEAFVAEQVETFSTVATQAGQDPVEQTSKLPHRTGDRKAHLAQAITTFEGYL